MKYQIYIKNEIAEIINKVASFEGKKPNTFLKEILESNFKFAYNEAQEVVNRKKGE